MTVYSNSPVNFAGVSQVTTTLGANDPEPGTEITFGKEKYIHVYNNGAQTIGVGFGAVCSGSSGYSVSVSSTSGFDLPIGFCKHAAIPAGSYGWLVTKGFTRVQMSADTSGAINALVNLGLNGTVAIITVTTGLPGPVCAKLLEACASGVSGMAFVKVY